MSEATEKVMSDFTIMACCLFIVSGFVGCEALDRYGPPEQETLEDCEDACSSNEKHLASGVSQWSPGKCICFQAMQQTTTTLVEKREE